MRRNPEIDKLYEIYLKTAGVCTDTRKIIPGSMFFALRGENFDANQLAAEALAEGAAFVVVEGKEAAAACVSAIRKKKKAAKQNGEKVLQGIGSDNVILVPDVLKALQQLACFHRKQFHIPVIGLTGTNGKTTTKELITAVLSCKFRVVSTSGNLNNHIGVPLTLLRMGPDTQVAVVEMGASAPGEIKMLAELVCPSFGLITNVGKAHLLGFGSFEGVKKTKGELYDYLAEHKKIAFVNVDNSHLTEMAEKRSGLSFVPYGVKNDGARILPAGENEPFLRLVVPNPCLLTVCDNMKSRVCECLAREQGVTPEKCEPRFLEIRTRLIGNYNADNVMAALCIGSYFAVPAAEAMAAIRAYEPSNNRSQMTRTEYNTLIIDAYNANPTSMRASLENFGSLNFPSKRLILGDMLELGEDSLKEHGQIAELALSLDTEQIYLVGEEFRKAVGMPQEKIKWFPDSEALREELACELPRGKTFLIKGSRGIKLERVFDVL